MTKKTKLSSGAHCVYSLHYHLVFVTKYRKKVFTDGILKVLFWICKDLCDKWEVRLKEFGGEEDHVHMLLYMPPKTQPSKFINNLKTVSSRKIREMFANRIRKFYWKKPVLWSRSYCLISAGGSPLKIIREYIQNQGDKKKISTGTY